MTFFKTTQEIDNPKPDLRRKKDWRCQATVPEGMVFVKLKRGGETTVAPIDRPKETIAVKSPLVQEMKHYIEESTPTVVQILTAAQIDGRLIVRALVSLHKVTKPDIVEAVDALLAEGY